MGRIDHGTAGDGTWCRQQNITMDLSIYLLSNRSSKEIAAFMNISNKGVEPARYRLRNKLELTRDQDLVGFFDACG